MSPFRILTVCTANICRSPASASLLQIGLDRHLDGGEFVVESAGVYGLDARPACSVTSELVATDDSLAPHEREMAHTLQSQHRSRPITLELIEQSDLILTLDRTHRSALAVLAPGARKKTFTLRQGAALAAYVTKFLAAGEYPPDAPQLPPVNDVTARLSWLLAEMDAARGLRPIHDSTPETGETDPLDVTDPHELGFQLHPESFKLIQAACVDLNSALASAIDSPGTETF